MTPAEWVELWDSIPGFTTEEIARAKAILKEMNDGESR